MKKQKRMIAERRTVKDCVLNHLGLLVSVMGLCFLPEKHLSLHAVGLSLGIRFFAQPFPRRMKGGNGSSRSMPSCLQNTVGPSDQSPSGSA